MYASKQTILKGRVRIETSPRKRPFMKSNQFTMPPLAILLSDLPNGVTNDRFESRLA